VHHNEILVEVNRNEIILEENQAKANKKITQTDEEQNLEPLTEDELRAISL
jgi:hypothetical protein